MRNYYRIYGDPVPYTAPKMALRKKRGGGQYPAFITPEKYKSWKNMVALVVKGSFDYEGPIQGPACITLVFYLKRPKSVKDKFPVKKPDLDNLCKGLIDAIKDGLLINDDNQVIEILASKYYEDKSNAPGVIIKVSEWQEGF